MRWPYVSVRGRLGLALGVSSMTSVLLFYGGAWGAHEHDFAYMIWNLFLAWVALGLTIWLERTLHRTQWSSWYALGITALWFIFLPNTFYMITDYIHVQELAEADLLNGIFMLSSFIINGAVLGFLSVAIVHSELLRRVRARTAGMLVGIVLLSCSFAMFIGRELRWNSWDIVVNPSFLLFDISERVIHAGEHPGMITAVGSFFILISSFYIVMWYVARANRHLFYRDDA